MNSHLRSVAVVVLSLCIIGLLAAPAVARSQPEDDSRDRNLERLWRLYPLDPEAGQQGPPTRTEIDTPEQAPPVPSEREQSRRPDEATRDDGQVGSSAILLLVTLALLSLISLLIVLVARRRGRPAPAARHGVPEILGPLAGKHHHVELSLPQQPAGRSPVHSPAEFSLVRVHLRDGRIVKGAVKHAATQDSPVLLLDVVDVSDAEGHKADPDPLDSFVPLAEVEDIETIGEADTPTSHVTERPQ